jgi:hypothetical protein
MKIMMELDNADILVHSPLWDGTRVPKLFTQSLEPTAGPLNAALQERTLHAK